MKIYFDGCSFTNGGYLGARHGVENHKEKRWSKLVANKLGGEEHNFSSSGGSNQTILRNITVNHDISDYDLAVILMTRSDRFEFFHNGKWHHVLPSKRNYDSEEIYEFWKSYYKNIHDKTYARTYEEMIKKSIKAICKSNNVPLVLMSNHARNEGSYDLIISTEKYGQITPSDKHPSLEAQSIIADDICNFINITSVL